MILQAAYLFQVRPRRGLFKPGQPMTRQKTETQFCDTSNPETPRLKSPPKDIHSLYKVRQLKDIYTRLTKLLVHPDFQPRLLRSSYSFRGDVSTPFSNNNTQQMHDGSSREYSGKKTKKTRRTRRDLRNYPIFVTGNPPDLVRLAMEFGHVPFVDHLLHRGFRPRDLPEYFELIPILSIESDSDSTDNQDEMHYSVDPHVTLRQQTKTNRQLLKGRAAELNRIWEQMRTANQELIDACSEADIDEVMRVLDAALVHSRPALDRPSHQQGEPKSIFRSEGDLNSTLKSKGKQRHLGDSESHMQYNFTSSGSVAYGRESDTLFVFEGAGVSSSSHHGSIAHSRNRTTTTESDFILKEDATSYKELDPATAYRAIFQPRQRVDSESSQNHHRSLSQISNYTLGQETLESQSHMPWVDGRALTSALLAVCLRRNGYESEEAEAIEESKAVPIVNEILKYDCMLTAQSLGQAVLSVAYSRPPNSIKRAYERRLKVLGKKPGHGRDYVHYSNRLDQSAITILEGSGRLGVMDLLMERIGPREWLKLIKSYLQRREFDDLAVILELCPFKGQQLEARDKTAEREYQSHNRVVSNDETSRRRQQARELICHETGICGVGTRMAQFSGRGPGQSSYNVSSTLHESSRIVFTGSGTRFSNTYMLPRGGFRGIGGNTSSHSSSVGNSAHSMDSEESFQESEDDGHQSILDEENHQYEFMPLQSQHQHSIDNDNHVYGNRDSIEYGNELGDNDEDDFNDVHDSSLAFGGVGSSTTSSSRPGPGIVGIAIQVQAPGYIMGSLLKMGFRFFSICDLSVSDTHPLALQFRQQEKMNKLLIEFCMAPNFDDMSSSNESQAPNKKLSGQKNRRKRDRCIYDESDKEYYAQATERFLYPAASYPARGATSIPAFPIHHPRSATGGSENFEKQQLSRTSHMNSNTDAAQGQLALLPTTRTSEVEPLQPQPQASALSPSNRLQFVLPAMQLGESFESIATAATTVAATSSNLLESQPAPIQTSGLLPVLPSAAFGRTQYTRSGLAKSMPLPIRASMIEARRLSGLSISAFMNNEMEDEVPTYHNMLAETTKRRVREHLNSEYIDLVTVGICLHQICFHKKGMLLSIVLDHRLLIAQDALSGAVQVAASVGWKRGLEILLMEHGDMEAEIDPVVTTKSDSVHSSASVKWDHATSEQLNFVKPRVNRGNSTTDNVSAPTRPRSTTTGGMEPLAGRGLRRHRSDGSRLARPASTSYSPTWDNGISRSLGGTSSHSFDENSRPSFDFTDMGVHEHHYQFPTLVPQILGSVVPTTRSSSLKVKLSSLLSSGGSTSNLNLRKKQKMSQVCSPKGNPGGSSSFNLACQEFEARKAQPSVIFLSTADLHSTPSVMMQRKNRNAVIALMAATARNDPALVHWLIESFADIKIAHIMQALMIACDRGYVRVVQTLVGSENIDKGTEISEPTASSRQLFRQWLRLQFQKIIEMTLVKSSLKEVNTKATSTEGVDPVRKRFDSFPFIFLMEASPVFRHYYQILNTLSSSQFMIKERNGSRSRSRSRNRTSPSTPGHSENLDTFFNVQNTSPFTFTDVTSPLRLHRRQQQDQQVSTESSSRPLRSQRIRNRSKPAQEIKQEIIRIMLDPLLEVFGSISFRKALDKMPKDCWWPVDHDVRLIVDQEARKVMVEIITTMKRQQKYLLKQQSRRRDQKLQQDGQYPQLTQRHQHVPREEPKTKRDSANEAKVDKKRWSERWHKVRRWATLKKKSAADAPAKGNYREKQEKVETKAAKSFFGSLRL
ncbi:hypothetical protein BGZ76_006843 [Entomortierella beljakovae]|nr:hypothetical protein BGZ76_006843 [Entomortierella beljakovae]